MRQVVLRAIGLLRRPAVVMVWLVLGVGGALLVRAPLLGQPGYELSEVLALLHGLLGGVFGIAAARQERRLIEAKHPRPRGALRFDSPLRSVVTACLAGWTLSLAALALPFVAALVYAATSTACDPTFSIGFFPMLTLPSGLLAVTVGALTGFFARRAFVAWLIDFGLVLASLVPTVWPIIFGPQIFAYNHLLGYLPGPLYDETLVLTRAVEWFRLETLLLTACAWLLTANLLDMRTGTLSRPHFRLGSAVLLAAFGFAVFVLEERGPALGTRMSDDVLRERLGGVRESEHFTLVHPRGKPKQDVERMIRDLEFRHGQVSTLLGGPPPGKVTVWWYESADQKQAWVGAQHTHFAKPWRHEVHIHGSPFPHPVVKHELVHAMLAPFGAGPFGVTTKYALLPNAGIIEGMAVAGDDPLEDLTLHEWAAGMRKQQLLPDVRTLMRLDGFYDAPQQRAYAAAGSFMRWLGETQGGEKLRALYRHGEFEAVYGKSLDALATEWEKFLDGVPLEPKAMNEAFARFRHKSLFQRTCAREVSALTQEASAMLPSDPEGAFKKFERCADLQPDDYEHKMNAADALERAGRKDEASTLLASLAPAVEKDASAAMRVAMDRADLYQAMHQPQKAQEQLKRVLELEPPADLDRTAHVKLAAIENGGDVGQAIWSWFGTSANDVKLLVLREALAKSPGQPEATYLIGRKLALGSQPVLAVKYLSQALSGKLPPSIAKEALRLKLEARYLSGDCAGLREEAKAVPDYGTVFRRRADEWVDRCAFEEKTFSGALVPDEALR